MQNNDPDKQEPEHGVSTIVKATAVLALVAGLTGIICYVARENPKNFSFFAPLESQPKPVDTPVKVAPQPKVN